MSILKEKGKCKFCYVECCNNCILDEYCCSKCIIKFNKITLKSICDVCKESETYCNNKICKICKKKFCTNCHLKNEEEEVCSEHTELYEELYLTEYYKSIEMEKYCYDICYKIPLQDQYIIKYFIDNHSNFRITEIDKYRGFIYIKKFTFAYIFSKMKDEIKSFKAKK
jgi:hypothetical protein